MVQGQAISGATAFATVAMPHCCLAPHARLLVRGAFDIEVTAHRGIAAARARCGPGCTILEFIKTSMPRDKPGNLSNDDYASILAFALKANGVDLHHNRINEENAARIVLHP